MAVVATTTDVRPAPEPSTTTTNYRAALAALVSVVLWASAFVGIRMAADAYSPGALAFGRLTVAALVLGVIAVRYRKPFPRGTALLLVALYGAAWFAAYTVVLNTAEHHLDAGTAAMLVNVAPILVAVFAGLFLAEGFPRPLLVGIAIAFSGVVLIGVGGSGGRSDNDAVGLALGLLAAALYAFGVLTQKIALRRIDAFTATFLGAATGAVVLLPFAPQFIAETATVQASGIALVVYLGVFPTAVAFTTWAYALARTNAGRLTATTLTVPAIAITLSWVILGELPTVLGMIGGALCLLGVAISRRR